MATRASETGFPEPLDKYRNTTRAYPGAKRGRDAFMMGSESALPLQSRRSFSLAGPKHRHTLSWGSVDPNSGGGGGWGETTNHRRPTRAHSVIPYLKPSAASHTIAEADEGAESAAETPYAMSHEVGGLGIQPRLPEMPPAHRAAIAAAVAAGHHRIGSIDSVASNSTEMSTDSDGCGAGPHDPLASLQPRSKLIKFRVNMFNMLRRLSSSSRGAGE